MSKRARATPGRGEPPPFLGRARLRPLIAVFLFAAFGGPSRAGEAPAVTGIAALRESSTETRTPRAFDLAATVWFADGANGMLILHDGTGAAEVLIDFGAQSFRPGDRVRISGTGTIMNCGCGYELAPLAVVDNDGIHGEREKSGSARLDAGRHPIRVDWFNASNESKLRVDYAGPGFSRRPISDSDLGAPARGLHFRASLKRLWMLPSNQNAGEALIEGDIKNFDHAVTGGREYARAGFTGFIEIRKAGFYTFFLTSDDGSRLFIGAPSLQIEKLAGPAAGDTAGAPLPEPRFLYPGQTLADGAYDEYLWSSLEGRASRAGHSGNESHLWLDSGAGRVRVEIADASRISWEKLQGRTVRVTGVARRGFSLDGVPLVETLFVQDASRVEVVPPGSAGILAREASVHSYPDAFRGQRSPRAREKIISVAEVERIDRSLLGVGKTPVRARIHGVVTRVVSSVPGIVLQDESRGIYVNLEHLPAGPVHIGELLEIAGTIDPGEFSPFIVATEITRRGAGIMPEPARPSREEMTNGSLHSQYVEIEGYVLAVDSRNVTLRTRSGVLRVETETETSPDWLNAVVRMRGCLRVFWDARTRQINTGKVGLDYAEISIVRPAPLDLFAVSAKHVSELLMFDPYAEPFQRARLLAQLVHQSGAELCLMEGGQGLRASLVSAARFEPGDLLEIAGFPEFDGPSAHLDHAMARKVGRAPLPPARALPEDGLLRDDYDATRVTVDAELIDMGFQDGNWTLQLRAGANTFRARFDARPEGANGYALGSRLRLAGVYRGLGGNRNLDRSIGAFELVLASAADVRVLATPPWWTLSRMLAVVGVLLVILALALSWITSLRRQVARQTARLETVLEERHRVQQAGALAKERSRLAYDLHDELGAGLSEIGMMSTLAASPSLAGEKRRSHLARLTDTARRLIASLDEIVWAVNPRYDPVSSFASYYTTYAQQFLELASLRCRLDVADDLPPHPLTSRVRHTLFLAFKETLTNVARHARACEVAIGIFTEKRGEKTWLVISVGDDGIGIQKTDTHAAASAKDGLASLAARLGELGGVCEIAPASPRGTRVRLEVPLA